MRTSVALAVGIIAGLVAQAWANDFEQRRGGGVPPALRAPISVTSPLGKFDVIDAGTVVVAAAGTDDGIRLINEAEIQWPDTKIAEVGTDLTITATAGINLTTGASGTVQLPSNTKLCFVNGGSQCLQRSTDSLLSLSTAMLVTSDISTGSTGDIIAGRNVYLTSGGTNRLTDGDTAVTVTACSGGTAATITWANGTAAFQFDVGTACTSESTAVITFPAATNGWVCSCSVTTADRMLTQRVLPSASTTTVTMQHITISTGANTDFTDSADVSCLCRGG